MKLAELGEFGLIESIRARAHCTDPAVVVGIGDDCAVFSSPNSGVTVISTDLLIEDVHFLRRAVTPKDLGYKSAAVNLSDIAAMGASPRFALLSLALPADLDVSWLAEFQSGFLGLLREHNTTLIGGDTTRGEKISISVTVIGESVPEGVKLRSGACVGDLVCVTDYLGDSAGGLRGILNEIPSNEPLSRLIQRHYRPLPQISLGRFLASRKAVTAMMDVSDGVASDVGHICRQSKVGAVINVDLLPVSPDLALLCSQFGWDSRSLAATGGEDYCLLFTVSPDGLSDIQSAVQKEGGAELHIIGEIVEEKRGVEFRTKDGESISMNETFSHFGVNG